jgi:hypothetical protein
MNEQDPGLRCGFRRSVGGDGVGEAGLVVVDTRTGEDGVAGDMDEAATVLRRRDRQADRALGSDCPVRLAA